MARYLTLQNLADTSIVNGDLIGQIGFAASNDSDGGDAIAICSSISVKAEGTFDASNNPGAIVFATAPNNGPTDRLKITNEGHFVPIADISYDLGVSGTERFKNLFVSGIGFTDGTYQTTAFTGGGGGTTYTADSGIELDGTTFIMGGTGYLDQLNISSVDSTQIPLTVKGAPSQSANLQEWQTSAGSIRLALDEDGVFQTSTPISAVFIRDSQRSNCVGFPDGNLCIAKDTSFTDGVSVRDGGATVNRNRGFYWNNGAGLNGGAPDTAFFRPSAGNVVLVSGNSAGSPRGELRVTGVDLGYIDFADATSQTTAFNNWIISVTGDTTTISDGETVVFSGQDAITTTRNGNTVIISGAAGGGGTPGGSDTYVQFNDGGSTFGGDAGFTYDKTAQKMYSRSYYTNITDSGNITTSVTLDLDQSNFHQVTLNGNPITLTVSNGDIGQRFIIRLKQDNTGSRTVNWFSDISWPGGGPPTLSTATGVADLLGFVVTDTNTYDGFLMVSGIY